MTSWSPLPSIRRRLRPAALLVPVLLGVSLLDPAAAQAARQPSLRSTTLYRVADPTAARSLAALRRHDPARARQLAKSVARPQAVWLGDWVGVSRVRSKVAAITSAASRQRTVPVLVVYDIPLRDCSSYAGGGARSAAEYRRFVEQVALGIGNRRAAVILEPDALAHITCLSAAGRRSRLALLSWAVGRLTRLRNAAVYVDAGHRHWQSPATMASRLRAVGIGRARGFALNVANFDGTASEVRYGRQISALVGGKPFVVDTGRNGRGPAPSSVRTAWCNPPGRGLGLPPTTRYRDPKVDALLWVKRVGESDGSCRPGAPTAGHWYLSYLLRMTARAAW